MKCKAFADGDYLHAVCLLKPCMERLQCKESPFSSLPKKELPEGSSLITD